MRERSISPCLELTKKAKERKNSVGTKLKTFSFRWTERLRNTYFVWEVQNTPTFIAFIYFTVHLKPLFIFSSHCHFFLPVSGVKLNYCSQSSHFLFPYTWMCVCIIYIQGYLCQLLFIDLSFLQLSNPLSLIPNNQNNPLTFYSFSFLIQSFHSLSFLSLSFFNQTKCESGLA